MPGMNNIVEQAKQFWATRTGRQKMFLLGGAGATALLLTLFARLLSTPDYKPLYKDLEPADAQALSTQLTAQNIPNKIEPDGKTVSVPADKLDAARMQTAQQGAPHSGRMGFELFDKMTWGQTEFDEKVAYQRALEGELERTIQTLANVEQAQSASCDAERLGVHRSPAQRQSLGNSEAQTQRIFQRLRDGDCAARRWSSGSIETGRRFDHRCGHGHVAGDGPQQPRRRSGR